MEILLVLAGSLVGVLSGFFGIGGGMILIPILLLIGIDIKSAIAISIVQMVFSSFYGSYLNYKKGSLILGDGIFVGIGGFLGGFAGAWVSLRVPDTILEYLFFGLLLFAHIDYFNQRLEKIVQM